MTDSAELEFCLSMSLIEEELLSLQTNPDDLSAIFAAVESFLQIRPLTANSSNLVSSLLHRLQSRTSADVTHMFLILHRVGFT